MNKTIYNTVVTVATVALSLTSCVKDDLYDTPHPDHGKIAVTADWTARGENIPIPDKWTIAMGDYTGEETETTHAPEHLFAPGEYTLTAWNPADHVAISGTMATVTPASGNWDGVGTFIANTPGWLLTSVQGVEIEKDRDHAFTAVMIQQVRQLTIVIEPQGDAASRITDIDAYLTGAAGSLDFSGSTYGNPSNVELSFSKITEGADAGKWTATVRLLGITGAEQHIKGSIRFAENNPKPIPLDSDLTTVLAGFNADKREPLAIGGTLVETPTESGFTATIGEWQQADGGNVDAH